MSEAVQARRAPSKRAATQPARTRLSAKEEAFAVAVASGATSQDAYLSAYDWKGGKDNARRQAALVAGRVRVSDRIKELRDAYAAKAVAASRGTPDATKVRAYTVSDAMDELDKAQTMAIAKENPAAMAKVVEIRMKLYGLGVADAKNPADREELPPEELEAALLELRAMRDARAKKAH